MALIQRKSRRLDAQEVELISSRAGLLNVVVLFCLADYQLYDAQ